MKVSSHKNSAPRQPLSIADIVARVRSCRSLPPPHKEARTPGRSITKRVGKTASLSTTSDVRRGTENQRRYWYGGKRQPAKIVLPGELDQLLQYAENGRYAERNRVLVLLSFKAGLRACEIAGLKREMVLGSDAAVSDQILLAKGITKGGRGRTIHMHAQL